MQERKKKRAVVGLNYHPMILLNDKINNIYITAE